MAYYLYFFIPTIDVKYVKLNVHFLKSTERKQKKQTIIYRLQYYSRLVHLGVIAATVLVKYNEWLNTVWPPKDGDANDGDVVGIREFILS